MNAFGVEDVSKGKFGEKLVAAKIALTPKGKHRKPPKPNLALRPLSTLKAIANPKG